MIPMVDLHRQFLEIRDEVFDMMGRIFESSQYVLGPRVMEFEKRIAEYTGTADAIGVASGTDALHLSIEALGIGEGDEVITTPFTFFATVEAILYTGARPVFADIDLETFNIDPDKIEERITSRTKALIPVHLFGHPADMERILDIASRHDLFVIEDAAQAFGASIKGRKVGSFGNTGCFSFYPSKNLGACGDGGMIVLRDRSLSESVRSLRNHGSKGSYIHDSVGFNSRLDEMQAGILIVKMKRVEEYNKKRRQRAAAYNKLLRGSVQCPSEREGFAHVYNQYTIVSPERDLIQRRLRGEGISSVIYYPRPLHLQRALAFFGYREGDFPSSEKVSREVLSLPIYPELEEHVLERIAHTVVSAIR
jgi:UDP-2-acetamido-2-deoxy-ribo-hexuluronate aminotransferase